MLDPLNAICVSNMIQSHYDIKPANVEFLQHSGSITYRITDINADKYVFKVLSGISRFPGKEWQDPIIAKSEMEWLSFLHKQSDVRVQEPIKTHVEDWLSWHEDADRLRVPCTLLRWAKGECCHRGLSSEEAEKSAILLARLHNISTGWTPPSDFTRPRFDEDYLLKAIAEAQSHLGTGKIPVDELDTVFGCLDETATLMSSLGESTNNWGLIHGDFNPANIVFENGEAIPIDFSECGFGHYLLDVAACLLHLGDMKKSFLNAYKSLRPIPSNPERVIDAFAIFRIILWLAFTASLPDRHEKVASIMSNFCVPHCKRFMQGHSFFDA